jgi:hypothetical protein
MATAKYCFLMRIKVLEYGTSVPLEGDRDLDNRSKHQDQFCYRPLDTEMLLLTMIRREEMRRREEQMRRGR